MRPRLSGLTTHMKDYKTETNISARVPRQLELDLTVSASTEVAQYQDSSRFGYFSILTRDSSGRASQHSYTLDKLPFILAEDGTLSRYFPVVNVTSTSVRLPLSLPVVELLI